MRTKEYGVWVSAIFSNRNSFKTLLGFGLLSKDIQIRCDFISYKEMHVRNIYGMECKMGRFSPEAEKQTENRTDGNVLCLAEFSPEITW